MLVFDAAFETVTLLILANENLPTAGTVLHAFPRIARNGRGPGNTPFINWGEENNEIKLIASQLDHPNGPRETVYELAWTDGIPVVQAMSYFEYNTAKDEDFYCDVYEDGTYSIEVLRADDDDVVSLEGHITGPPFILTANAVDAPLSAVCAAALLKWQNGLDLSRP